MAKRGGCLQVAVLAVVVPVVLGLGLLLVANLNRVLTHDTTQGVIVDLILTTDSDGDAAYTPVFRYVVDGRTYLYESAVSYSGMIVPSIGDTRTMLYDPDNPVDARVRNTFLLIWLPIILMLLPILIAAGVFWSIRRRRRTQQLPPWDGGLPTQVPDAIDKTSRMKIPASFMGAEPSQMDEQGRVRYRVKARAEIGDTIYRFVSDWLDEDPTLYYMQHGNIVDVLVDPDDPGSYEVVLPPE